MSLRASSAFRSFVRVALFLMLGCSGVDGGVAGTGGNQRRASVSVGGTTGRGGGTSNPGGITSTSGSSSLAGDAGRAGTTVMGGTTSTGGSLSSTSAGTASSTGGGGRSGGAASTGTRSSGGAVSSGGTLGSGGSSKVATTSATESVPRDAGPDGARDAGDAGRDAADGGESFCSIPMPTAGGKTQTGRDFGGTLDGVGYGIWTEGSGGTITIFPNHAFSASWSESKDFLAHVGLDYRTPVNYADLGTIVAEFSEKKSGTAGGFSMIGIYGWTQNPCVEWYINEDSWHGLNAKGNVTATIDGGTYTLSTLTTTGTGGANACERGHSGPWTQMISTRKGARSCGTVTVSDHFAAWKAQGWKLGGVTSIHINVEVGGGTGKIDFPWANITTTGK